MTSTFSYRINCWGYVSFQFNSNFIFHVVDSLSLSWPHLTEEVTSVLLSPFLLMTHCKCMSAPTWTDSLFRFLKQSTLLFLIFQFSGGGTITCFAASTAAHRLLHVLLALLGAIRRWSNQVCVCFQTSSRATRFFKRLEKLTWPRPRRPWRWRSSTSNTLTHTRLRWWDKHSASFQARTDIDTCRDTKTKQISPPRFYPFVCALALCCSIASPQKETGDGAAVEERCQR